MSSFSSSRQSQNSQQDSESFLAGRLLQWGLRPQSRPAQEEEYQQLIDRYQTRSEFRQLVAEFAEGIGVRILDVSEHGLSLVPDEDSVFALKPGDFRHSASSAESRLLDGLVQIAIAATVFPRAEDFQDDNHIARPPVQVTEIDASLRELCDRLEESQQNDAASNTELAGLTEAWRVYQRRMSVQETRDQRQAARTTRRIIEYNLEKLREHGCFTRHQEGEQTSFQPTWKYQTQVRELAATSLYQHVQKLRETTQISH